MQNYFFTIELVVNEYLHVVLLLGNINRNVNTTTFDFDRNGLGVVLVFKEKRELLIDAGQLDRHERKLDFGAGITINLRRPFEGYCGKELFEDQLLIDNCILFLG